MPPNRTPSRRALLAALSAAALAAASSASAQTYSESGDAGSAFNTAASTVTAGGGLTGLSGTISSAGDADFYRIQITNPAAFSVIFGSGSAVDTQIYLFTAGGNAILLNDDNPNGTSTQGAFAAGTFSSLSPGFYILGISLSGVDPVNAQNQPLFAAGLFSTDLRGPAPGANGPVTGVFDSGFGATPGTYLFNLTGAAAAIPEPGTVATIATMSLAGFMALRRRARRA